MAIFDFIGGAPSVTIVVERLYERVLADPKLAWFFEGVDMDKLKSHQRAFMAAAIGGPEIYSGRDMAAAHAGLSLTGGDFDAVVAHLVATLDELDVPAEIIAGIGGALGPLRSEIVGVPAL